MLGKNDSFTKIFCTRGRLIISNETNLNSIIIDENNIKNDLNSFMEKFPKIWIEIGFGTGDNIIHQLKNNTEIGIIGCDPFVNGALKFCNKLTSKNLDHSLSSIPFNERIKVVTKPAGYLIDNLKSESIDKIFVLFPDPWPKKKHNKRRIFSIGFLTEILRILKPNGELCFATDNHEYGDKIIELINNFTNEIENKNLHIDKNIDEIKSKYAFEKVILEKYFDYLAETKYMKKAKNEPMSACTKKILIN